MKKSIFATFFMLFALLGAPVVHAEDITDETTASSDEPLPPLIDPAIAGDSAQ